ncbi:MAG: hypothetical protein GWN58_05155, partial [Anaerolineae bacterium]|nr:hypothetical protein [Anaerolineae bacterium]
GVVKSDQAIQVSYAGRALQSRQGYFWKVLVTANDGSVAESPVASWSMGILDSSEWQAKWIGLEDNPADDSY